MFINHHTRLKQAGYSLLEVLLVLAVSVIILLILTNVLLAFKKSYFQNEANITLQEKARFLESLLTRSLRSAGFSSCGKPVTNAIRVYSAANFPEHLNLRPKFGSDIIVVTQVSAAMAKLVAIHNNHFLINSLSPSFKAGDQLFVSNCLDTNILNVRHVSVNFSHKTQSILVGSHLSPTDFLGSMVGQKQASIFFVAKSKLDGEALFLKNFRGRTLELLPGVERLSVQTFVKKWRAVRVVRVSALIRYQHYSRSITFNIPLEERL